LISLGRVQAVIIDYARSLAKQKRISDAVVVLRKLFILETDTGSKVVASPIPLNAQIRYVYISSIFNSFRVQALKFLFELLVKSTTNHTYLVINEEEQNKAMKQYDEEFRTNVSVKSSTSRAASRKEANPFTYHTPRTLIDEIYTIALCLEKSENVWEGLVTSLGENACYKSLMPVRHASKMANMIDL
jgi:hypothetical protein